MPVFNAEKYLKSAITSILTQTYKNLELFVINDCSNDGSMKIISSFNDHRVKIISNSLSGKTVYFAELDKSYRSTKNFSKEWSKIYSKKFIKSPENIESGSQYIYGQLKKTHLSNLMNFK